MSGIREAASRFAQRWTDRVRGEPSVEWMVANGLQLGEGTHIAHPIYLDRLHPWLITIGDYCNLAPYVALVTHDQTLNQYTGQTRLGCVTIGSRVNIGVGAILLPGTTIGEDSVVAAGAVVHGDVPAGSVVAGNPAQVSKIRAIAAWHQASAARAPNWPREGWTLETGITEERKREQREALANCASGYVPARAAPGSPYARKQAAKANRPAPKVDGNAPAAVGDAPKADGDAPKAVGDAPKAVGDAPKAVGDAPKAVGDAPKAVGDAPKPGGEEHASSEAASE